MPSTTMMTSKALFDWDEPTKTKKLTGLLSERPW